MKEHHEGNDDTHYTAQRLPLKLVYYEWHQYLFNAIRREKQIKNWSRAKKIALINGQFDELKELSRCKNRTTHLNCPIDKLHRVSAMSIDNSVICNLSSLTRTEGFLPRGSSNGFRENASYFLTLHFGAGDESKIRTKTG